MILIDVENLIIRTLGERNLHANFRDDCINFKKIVYIYIYVFNSKFLQVNINIKII